MPELKSGILAYIFSDDDDMKDGDRDQLHGNRLMPTLTSRLGHTTGWGTILRDRLDVLPVSKSELSFASFLAGIPFVKRHRPGERLGVLNLLDRRRPILLSMRTIARTGLHQNDRCDRR